MSDVAVAEGDAAKGEIVISPAVHQLIHTTTVNRSESQAQISEEKEENHRILPCGCECMTSGYFKIGNSLEDMICAVDFSGAALHNSALDPGPSTENLLAYQELQYELDVYTDVVDELMAGYKVVSPELFEKFSNVVQRLTAQSDSEGT